MEEDNKGTALSNVIRIDDDRVKEHLDKVVRGTVEETLNAMLERAFHVSMRRCRPHVLRLQPME